MAMFLLLVVSLVSAAAVLASSDNTGAMMMHSRRVPHATVLPPPSSIRGGDSSPTTTTATVAARPSAAQLAWLELEVGGNICYGIGEPGAPWWNSSKNNCYGNLTAPPAAKFNSTPDFTQARTYAIAVSGGPLRRPF